ncbi:MAG: helix-turn-helix transcriptional regulator [Candidatus Heimdallarchaeota archaeon]|nr:helix-turn-helix transcriptional regulator [Candidatus Heimdallarchaeota archaeon]
MAKLHALELNLPEILYDHWNTIPIIQDVSKSVIDKLGIKQAQHYIIAALSKALEDEYPSGLRKRYAMTASEIQEIMKTSFDFEVNKSNLYYHLQKLVDGKVIQIVTSVQSANIVTSYYGRNSKLIFSDPEIKEKSADKKNKNHYSSHPILKLLKSKQFSTLLESYKPNKSKLDEIATLVDKVSNTGYEHNREFMSWIIDNEEHFQGNDIDLLDFNRLYNQMKAYDDNMMKLFSLLQEIFKI